MTIEDPTTYQSDVPDAPTLDMEQRIRAISLGTALDDELARLTFAGQDLGMIGIGLGQYAGQLRMRPDDVVHELGPWLRLAGEAMAYIETGTRGPALDGYLGAHLDRLTGDTPGE